MSVANFSRAYAIRPVETRDPSLEMGYELQFDKELSLEFRNYENQESETKMVRFRILTKPDEKTEELGYVRFEIIDDADLFFFVEAQFNPDEFEQMKKEDQLLIEFEDFPREVQTMLEDSLKPSSESEVKFVEDEDGSGVMEFNQLLDLKSVEIFRLKFVPSQPDFVGEQAQYRYSVLAFELARKKALCAEFTRQMQSKNPILLRAINSTGKSPRIRK